MGNDMDYGLKLVLSLRNEYDEVLHRKSNTSGMKHVYSFNQSKGITENVPTRDEGSFEVEGLGDTVDYTLDGSSLLRMSHSFEEIENALNSGPLSL